MKAFKEEWIQAIADLLSIASLNSGYTVTKSQVQKTLVECGVAIELISERREKYKVDDIPSAEPKKGSQDPKSEVNKA